MALRGRQGLSCDMPWVLPPPCNNQDIGLYMVVFLNYCSQNGGNLYRAPYYNGNPNIGPRIIGNLAQSPYIYIPILQNHPAAAEWGSTQPKP